MPTSFPDALPMFLNLWEIQIAIVLSSYKIMKIISKAVVGREGGLPGAPKMRLLSCKK